MTNEVKKVAIRKAYIEPMFHLNRIHTQLLTTKSKMYNIVHTNQPLYKLHAR